MALVFYVIHSFYRMDWLTSVISFEKYISANKMVLELDAVRGYDSNYLSTFANRKEMKGKIVEKAIIYNSVKRANYSAISHSASTKIFSDPYNHNYP